MKSSLKVKIGSLLIIFAAVLTLASIFVGTRIISDIVNSQYKSKANELSATVAQIVDKEDTKKLYDEVMAVYNSKDYLVMSSEWGSDEFNAYIDLYKDIENTEEFKNILSQLRSVQDVNDVDCIYLACVESKKEVFIYMCDAALEDACPPGVIDEIYEVNKRVLEDANVGFPAYITNTEEYGWLVTAGSPIYGSDGEVICYAFTDISMDMIKSQERYFTLSLISILMVITFALLIVAIFQINKFIIRPVNLLANAANKYVSSIEDENRSTFSNLPIHTGDEIESLHKSIMKMEKDIDGYISNLVDTRAKLKETRKEATIMSKLAYKDALTGLQNKMSYDRELERLNKELENGNTSFGLAMIDLNELKTINDNYGHSQGDISIITIANIISKTFSHSPIYRIGGDEFVVSLKNNDYDKIEELEKEFYENIRINAEIVKNPWEKVSAALGYALYDPKIDANADDVYVRADKIMYDKKKEMKQR